MARQRLRRGDQVAYLVWTFTNGHYVRQPREAQIIHVRDGKARLYTTHDGGKTFTLPLTEVRR